MRSRTLQSVFASLRRLGRALAQGVSRACCPCTSLSQERGVRCRLLRPRRAIVCRCWSHWVVTVIAGSYTFDVRLFHPPSARLPRSRECLFPVAIAAPVSHQPNILRRHLGCQKGQLPGGFEREAWGFNSGTIRKFSLQTAFSLRSLGVDGFTLQAFS
jgi:hypothetical protein